MLKNGLKQVIFLLKALKRKFDVIQYSGGKIECPFCGYKSDKLSLIGSRETVMEKYDVVGGKRRVGGCLKCGSKDRHRLVLIYLKEVLKIFKEKKQLKILHMAPEKTLSKYIQANCSHEYICGDLDPGRYEHVKRIEKIDLLEIPYPDNTFDLVICNHLLEHIPDDLKAMSEIYRVLKPGGKAILQVPYSIVLKETFEDFTITDPDERRVAFGQSDHVRIYGLDFPERIKKSGFELLEENLSVKYPGFGLNPKETLYIGVK